MSRKYIWADLIALGTNGWNDQPHEESQSYGQGVADFLRCEDKVWRTLTENARDVGMNMVVIDLMEGLVYPSHPELAVKGSWTPSKLRKELGRLRHMGLEPIPKLNFSARHDIWLRDYSRMLSTATYYRVVEDLIRDVCKIFDGPRFVHIGMDEETPEVQAKCDYIVCRRGPVWFHDLAKIVSACEQNGAKAWMWSDLAWGNPDYYSKVSKNVLQSNWYYWKDLKTVEAQLDDPHFSVRAGMPSSAGENHPAELKAFFDLDKFGFDQIPGATNWDNEDDMRLVVDFSMRRISPKRLKGFFLMPWKLTADKENAMQVHARYFELVDELIKEYDS